MRSQGLPELPLGSPLSPFTEAMPQSSSLPRSSNIRFSLCPVLTLSCPPRSPGLELQEEEAGGLCASMIHPLTRAPASPGPQPCAKAPPARQVED